MSSASCKDYFPSQMVLLSTYCIVELFQISLCIISFGQLRTTHKKRKFSKLSIFGFCLFYGSSFTFAISRIITTICFCFNTQCYIIPWSILFLSYMIHLFGLEFILYSRLKLIFHNTEESISHTCSILVYISWTLRIGIVSGVLIIEIVFKMLSLSIILGTIGLCVFFTLIISQILAWLFVIKLRRINKQCQSSADISSNIELLNIIRRYAILSVIAVMFTSFYAVVVIISAPISNISSHSNYVTSASQALMMSFDVALDTLCMVLSLAQNGNIYKRICALCHNNCFGAKNIMQLELQNSQRDQIDSGSLQNTITSTSAT
eukprot:155893_1